VLQHPADEISALFGLVAVHVRADMLQRVAADRAAVNVTEMGQIHQVVDHQHVVRLDLEHRLAVRPFHRVVVIRVVDDLTFIGQRRIAHPDPQNLVAFDQREVTDIRLRRDVLLAGNVDAVALGVEGQSVIAALQPDISDGTVRQRRAAVTAAVFQGAHIAVGIAVDDDRLVHNRPRQKSVVDLLGPGGDVPGITHERLVSLASHISLPIGDSVVPGEG